MDELKRARLAKLLQRQARTERTPAVVEAWLSCGVTATELDHEEVEDLIDWLRAHWRQPEQRVDALDQHLQLVTERLEAVLVLNFWDWDEAVAVRIPASDLTRTGCRLREIYPDGFLVADQRMSKALLVNFPEDHVGGAEIAQFGLGGS